MSIGLWAACRFQSSNFLQYIIAQVLGAIVAGGVLMVIANGAPGFELSAGFASNGFGDHSPGGYSMTSALVTEVVMTMMFLIIILGATDSRARGISASCHRHVFNTDSSHQYSSYEYFSKSCS